MNDKTKQLTVIYLGSLSCTDSDFPLIRALQQRGVNIIAYFPVGGKSFKSGLISIDRVEKIDSILHASRYEAFKSFEKYLNLDHVYIVNNYHDKRYNWQSWIIWIKFFCHARQYNPDLFHFIWPFAERRKILYFWRIKKVLTVHDPIAHSSQQSKELEKIRIKAFTSADKLVLLSPTYKKCFCKNYNIESSKIFVSRFGYYDWLHCIDKNVNKNKKPYILFWGQIQAHKGIDILLKAMVEVHKVLPNLSCVIAGKGKFSFNISQYESLDYIDIKNYFIEINELVTLLDNCLFAVAPYKDATQSGVVQTAFSAGVPLIVTNVGSLPEAVEDGETGLVVPPNDVKSLAEAIIEMASDDEKRFKLKSNIKHVWKKNMSWKTIADGYVNVYKSLVKETK